MSFSRLDMHMETHPNERRVSFSRFDMRMETHPNEGRSSTTRSDAQRYVDAAVANLLAHRGDVDACIEEALRHDPDCVTAYCVRASAALLAVDHPRAADPRTFHVLDRLYDEADDPERAHIDALRAWHDGDVRTAVERYGRLLHDRPHDVLALHVAHALDFRLGERECLRDRIASALAHWQPDMPHFGHVLAMYAFGLEENGDFIHAHALARRSLELVPDNAAAIHVVAHVLEMQGRSDEGVAWLETTRTTWSGNRASAAHIAWHLALFHVDRGDSAAALATYDETLRPSPSTSTPALVDASALLWRLELRGVDVAARWRSLAAAWRRKPLRGMRAFNLVHAVIAFAAGRRRWRARHVIALLRSDGATRAANQPHDLQLAIPVSEALAAFARGNYRYAVDRLTHVRAMAERCGGSVAQCDLIMLTLLEAALRSRRARLAHALASERNARRPASLLNRWLFARASAVLAAAWLPARSG